MIRLSDLVQGEGYGFLVHPEPHRLVDVLGDPKDPHGFDALVCCDYVDGLYVACMGDDWDHVYGVSHEIAEHRCGFGGHSERLFSVQCQILTRWVKRLGGENARLSAGVDNKETSE